MSSPPNEVRADLIDTDEEGTREVVFSSAFFDRLGDVFKAQLDAEDTDAADPYSLFASPYPRDIAGAVSDLRIADFTVTLPAGVNEINFDTGRIQFADGRQAQLSSSLKSTDEDVVRATALQADAQVLYEIPRTDPGEEGSVSSALTQFETQHFTGIRMTKLKVRCFRPTNVLIAASPQSTLSSEVDGLEGSFQRTSYDTAQAQPTLTVEDSYESVPFSTEEDIERGNPTTDTVIECTNIGTVTFNVTNAGNEPVDFAVQGRNTAFSSTDAFAAEDWTGFANLSESSPQTVAAGDSEFIRLDNLHSQFARVRVQSGTSNTATDVAITLAANTE